MVKAELAELLTNHGAAVPCQERDKGSGTPWQLNNQYTVLHAEYSIKTCRQRLQNFALRCG